MAFSLWVFILLSLFCLGIGFRTFIQTRKTKFFLNKKRAFYLAVSGVKIAEEILDADDPAVDHLGEDWAKPIEKRVSFSSPKKEGVLSVEIKDELSRININKIEEPVDGVNNKVDFFALTKALFSDIGIQEPSQKPEYIFDYIDEDKVSKGGDLESEKYGKIDAKNAKLSVMEELISIKNITKEDYQKITDFFTVFGDDGKININTAGRELLEFLLKDQVSLKAGVIDTRFIGDNKYYLDGTCGGDREGCVQLPGDLINMFRVKSDIFRIVSTARVDGVEEKITCVFDRSGGKILYWNER